MTADYREPERFMVSKPMIKAGIDNAIRLITPIPVPLAERRPGPEDRDGELVWAGCRAPGLPYWEWCLDVADLLDEGGYTHWLPASTRFLPARVEG
jgi:hypothetical protein